jgi:hypothetical protein
MQEILQENKHTVSPIPLTFDYLGLTERFAAAVVLRSINKHMQECPMRKSGFGKGRSGGESSESEDVSLL